MRLPRTEARAELPLALRLLQLRIRQRHHPLRPPISNSSYSFT